MDVLETLVLVGTSEKLVFRDLDVTLRHHFHKRGGVVVSKAADCDHFVRRASTEKLDLLILAGPFFVTRPPACRIATGEFGSCDPGD